MIRFIINRRLDNGFGCGTARYETVDAECPELERALSGGMYLDRPGFDIPELIGAEILPVAASQEKGE